MGEGAQYEGICQAENKQVEPFFSIIIPVFNGEAFIEDCLNSIVHQRFGDDEILVINDGSSDATLQKIMAFADQYSQVRVIDLGRNQGAAAARNRGISESRGRFLLFVDGDDVIAQDLLASLHQKISSESVEDLKLVVFGLVEEYFDENNRQTGRKEVIPSGLVSEDKREIRKAIIELEGQTLYGYLWNKVYNRAYLKSLDLTIPDMKILEDIYFNIQYCQDIDSIIVMETAPYTYKKRYGTATGRRIPDYYQIHKGRMERLMAQYESWGMLTESNRQALGLTYTRYLFSSIQRIRKKEIEIGGKSTGEWLAQVFETDQVYCELIEKSEVPVHGILSFMYRSLKEKRVFQIELIAKGIHFVEKWLRPLYLKVK